MSPVRPDEFLKGLKERKMNANSQTVRWVGKQEVEPGWSIVEVSRVHLALTNSGSTYLVYIQKDGHNFRSPARYDVDKGMFLDPLPITFDSNIVKNLIRSIEQR